MDGFGKILPLLRV